MKHHLEAVNALIQGDSTPLCYCVIYTDKIGSPRFERGVPMRKRPLPIAIIGWFLMISAAFSLYSVLTIQNSPVARDLLAQSGLSLNVHIALGVMGALITVACAWGILKGLDWGRVVYVGWGIIGAIIGFLTSPVPSMILVGLAFLAVFTFFLFRPTANLWFGKTYFGRGNHDAESA